MDTPDAEKTRKYARKRATEIAKLDEAFIGKYFQIVREVHLPPEQCYRTQFGNTGRHGYIIRDVNTGEQQVVGGRILRILHDHYGAVELPYRTRHRLTASQRAQQNATALDES